MAAPARPPARPGGSRAGAGKVDLARWAATEDARLLWLLRTILSMKSLRLRIVFLALGFTAIGPLALAYAELLPLPVGGRFILLPAATTVLAVGMRHTAWGRRALVGYIAGFVATGIYDCLRLSLTAAGLFPGDPIPGIGRLLLNDPDASWIWGYAWRFLGNGAGMGMAFAMLPWRGWKFGVAYGATICTGLFVVLAVFPPAQEHFFPLEVGVGIGAMLGHWVYGGVLGWLCTRYLPPVRWAPSAAGASDTNVAAAAPGRAAHGGRQAPGYQAPGYQAQGPTRQSGAGRGSGQYQRAGAGGREPAGPRTGQHPVTGAPPRQRTGQYPAVNGKQYPAVNGNGRGTSGQYPAAPAAATTGNGNGNGRANGNGNGRANDNGNGRANGNGNGRANGNGNGRANGNGHATSNGNGNGRRSGASGPYSAEFPVVTPGSVPPSAISGPIPVVPGVPGNGRGPGAGRSGQFPAVPGGRDFPALPPGTVPPSAISGPIPAIPANGPAPRPQQRQTSQSGQQRVVPSRAQRHPPKEPKPW